MDYYYQPNEVINHYRILKILGEGRYGIAYLAADSMGYQYVIKQLKKKMLKTTRQKNFYEQKILKILDSPQFPHFIDTFYDGKSEGYIMEYKAGKVFEQLIIREGWQFNRQQIYHIADQLLDLLTLLHEQGIVHRDIRTPNVILGKQNELILIDFGLARFIDYKRYIPQMDYWYLGDFLIHLYYTHYHLKRYGPEAPWYKSLALTEYELYFLKRLMGLEKPYDTLDDIRFELHQLMFLA